MKLILFLIIIAVGVKFFVDFDQPEIVENFAEPEKISVDTIEVQEVNSSQSSSNTEVSDNAKSSRAEKNEESILKKDKQEEQALFEKSEEELATQVVKVKNKTPPRPFLDEKGEINHDPSDTPF